MVNASKSFDYTLYADDTTLLASHNLSNGLVDTASSELSKFEDWTVCSRLSLNKKKTQLINFSNRHSSSSSESNIFGNEILTPSHSAKFLGIHIDKSLTFKEHISSVCTKVSRSIGILYKLAPLTLSLIHI